MARRKTSLELYAMRIVKDKREAAGISQRQLSMDMNLDMGAVGKVEDENDPAKYNINHLNALARYFNCDLWDFFPDEPFADKNTRYIVKE
ncbi:helix-turn-helix domain-containing protein [Butyricimonas virosa]|uniref:helix-turn-helix domain-containing protein n=1 Tax=Butyricimonas virosa TaxID=544645 RepID=UPI0032C03E65